MIDARIHSRMMFRLLFSTQDNRYEPETASHLLRGLHGLDDESARVMVRLWAQDAMVEEGEHRN